MKKLFLNNITNCLVIFLLLLNPLAVSAAHDDQSTAPLLTLTRKHDLKMIFGGKYAYDYQTIYSYTKQQGNIGDNAQILSPLDTLKQRWLRKNQSLRAAIAAIFNSQHLDVDQPATVLDLVKIAFEAPDELIQECIKTITTQKVYTVHPAPVRTSISLAELLNPIPADMKTFGCFSVDAAHDYMSILGGRKSEDYQLMWQHCMLQQDRNAEINAAYQRFSSRFNAQYTKTAATIDIVKNITNNNELYLPIQLLEAVFKLSAEQRKLCVRKVAENKQVRIHSAPWFA